METSQDDPYRKINEVLAERPNKCVANGCVCISGHPGDHYDGKYLWPNTHRVTFKNAPEDDHYAS